MITVTPAQALARLRDGFGPVRMTVGASPEDPVLVLWREHGRIMSRSVGGWSEGVVEPVCAASSDFLRTYLLGRERLEAIA